MRLSRVLGAVVVCGAILAPSVRADLVFEAAGAPQDAESWYQGFHLNTSRMFQNVGLALIRLPGDDRSSGFKPPAWDIHSSGSSRGSFTGSWVSRFVTRASGPMTNDLVWSQHFDGDREGQRFVLTLFAWDNRFQSIQTAAARWNGTRWTFGVRPGMTWEEFNSLGGVAGVPAPSAVLLAMLGFGLVGTISRKLR